MNCFPIFIYLFFIVLYIILFIFLFQAKIENVIFIFLFILTVISGFNFVFDIKKLGIVMNFKPIEELFDEKNGLELIKLLFFSPMTTLVIFIFFICNLYFYISKTIAISTEYILILAFLLFITNMVQTGVKMKQVNVSYVFSIPILTIIFSLLLIIISIYKLNNGSSGRKDVMPFSQIDPESSLTYKVMMILNLIILICFLIYFILFYEEKDVNMQFQLYTIVPFTYGMSGYMLYLSSKFLKKKMIGI